MSRRNKGIKMSDKIETGEDLQEPVVKNEEQTVDKTVSDEVVDEQSIELPVVEQVINSGALVSKASSALGAAVNKETAQRILAQPSKLVAPTLSKFEQKVQAFLNSGNNTQINLIGVLKRYQEEMHPNKTPDLSIVRIQQKALWNTINTVINTEDNFRDNWRMLVSYFRNNRDGAFGDKYVNRFMDMLNNFNNEEKQAFLNMLALISVACTVDDVKKVQKFIVLDKALVRPIKAEARQRIINFYS